MKIKDVTIKIVKGDVASQKEISGDENKVREACGRELKRADASKARSVVLSVLGHGKRTSSLVACAKILSQEIFRYLREEKHAIKEIKIVLAHDKELRLFKKTAYSYLAHIIHKMSQGPFITVDTIIETGAGIVLIKRSNPPFGWAIPGGFVDYGETLEQAAAREAKEETGLNVKNLKQLHTYSDPDRDPRFHTVTTVFVCQAKGSPKAASDAKAAGIFKPGEWKDLQLAFDHEKVLRDYLQQKSA